MALKVTKADVWSTTIQDRSGGAADKLEPLAKAGANFEFVFARRTPEQPGQGLALVAPVKGAKVVAAAKANGWDKAAGMHSLRIEGTNKPGTGAKVMRALADAGISFRGFSAASLGSKAVCYIALDNAEDAAKAASVLRKL